MSQYTNIGILKNGMEAIIYSFSINHHYERAFDEVIDIPYESMVRLTTEEVESVIANLEHKIETSLNCIRSLNDKIDLLTKMTGYTLEEVCDKIAEIQEDIDYEKEIIQEYRESVGFCIGIANMIFNVEPYNNPESKDGVYIGTEAYKIIKE